MWGLKKKRQVLGLEVPDRPPVPVGEVRSAYARAVAGPISFDGPFPLLDDKGRYLCKSCGVAFDSWNLGSAITALRGAVLEPSSDTSVFFVNCRKCSRCIVFSAKDVITGHQSDPLGPWTDQELGMADLSLTMLFKFSPDELRAITPQHFHKVLFLYR